MNDPVEVPDGLREVQGVVGAARAALTDEMIGRLAGSAADSLDLVDQLSRAGVAKAIPVIANLVNSGDLQRVVDLARVYASAQDALSDDIIGRLAEAASGGISLLDQVNRSSFHKALPIISKMAVNGDLERLAQLASVYGAAQDALSDEMVGRLSETLSEGLSLLDRFHRGGAGRLLDMLEHMDASGALERMVRVLPPLLDRLEMLGELLQCVQLAAKKSSAQPAAGGIGSAWSLLTDARNQQTLQFMMALGEQMQQQCAKRDLPGGAKI